MVLIALIVVSLLKIQGIPAATISGWKLKVQDLPAQGCPDRLGYLLERG